MKYIPVRLLAALAGLASLWSAASASLPYTDGDLLLGVRAGGDPGATQDLVVDLGPAARFTQATEALTVPELGNLATDLATFSESGGAAWSTRADVYWGIVGTDAAGDPANTLYVSRPRVDPAGQSTAWPRRTYSSQSTTNSTFRAFISGYTLSDANAASPKATRQSTSAANSYASFTAGGSDFGVYSNLEGDFGAGTAGSVLDLYRLTPTTQNPAGQGLLYVGSFQFSDSGALTFTPAPATAPFFRFSTASVSVREDAGSVTLHVQRTGLTTGADSVTLTTSDGTAVAGTDYTTKSVTVQFAAGETAKDVTVDVANVAGLQQSRTFTAALSSPSAGELRAPSTATVTITDAEPQNFGSIAFSSASSSVSPVDGTAAPSAVTVTLLRTGGTDGAVSVEVAAAAGGTLVSGTDFTGLGAPTTVQFAAGETSKTFTLQLAALADAKLPGTIQLALSNPQGGASLGAVTATTISVTAHDKVRPTLVLTTRSGRVTAGTFSVAGSARDNSAIDRVEVRVNGGPVQLATLGTAAGTGRAFDLSGVALENGLNILVITPFDASGNAGASSTLRVTYANSRPALAGIYNGLLTPAGTPSLNSTGFVTLTVSPVGIFTGKVTIGAAVVPVRGIVDNAGEARFNVGTNPTTAAPTTLALSARVGRVTTAYGNLVLAVSTDLVTGTLKDTAGSVVADVEADRATFNAKTNPLAATYLANHGSYTVIFPARASQTGLSADQYPQGDGYGFLKVTAAGQVTLAGTLADGTAVSASAPLSKSYTWPSFAKIRTTGGVISGPVQFDDTQAGSDLRGLNLLWLRPEKATSPYYPAGWPNGIQVDLLGAKYAVTAGASALPGLGADDLTNGNAKLTFTDGNLAVPIVKAVNISAANRITHTPADTSFTLALTPATGLFSGKFKHTDGTSPLFKGAIFQKGASAAGYGFFLSTVPHGSTTGESGSATLTPR